MAYRITLISGDGTGPESRRQQAIVGGRRAATLDVPQGRGAEVEADALTVRVEVRGEGPGVELLKTAGRSVPVELRDLAPLKRSDIRSALATVLGQARIPTDVVQTLERATEGNPRLLGELLELLVDHGVLDLSGARPELKPELLKDVKLPAGVVEATVGGSLSLLVVKVQVSVESRLPNSLCAVTFHV